MKVAVLSLTIAFCLGIGHAEAQNISDEAMRHFDRGQAAVEMAKSPTDYENAIKEFEKAATLASDWPDVYYNLGFILEKVGKRADAIENLAKYLELSPNASDAREVKKFIAKIEYAMEQAKTEYDKIKDLLGTWDEFIIKGSQAGQQSGMSVITAKNGVIEVNTPGTDAIGSAQFDGQKLKFKYSKDQYALQGNFEYDMKIISKVLMRGYSHRKIVGVRYPDLAEDVGRIDSWAIELRKR